MWNLIISENSTNVEVMEVVIDGYESIGWWAESASSSQEVVVDNTLLLPYNIEKLNKI